MFPILDLTKEQISLGCPRFVPIHVVVEHERQANINHQQSVSRLAQRGGLTIVELSAVLNDEKWHPLSDVEAIASILKHIKQKELSCTPSSSQPAKA
jgi:hypothetical protein